MNPSVYIETTIVGYLTAWPRKDPRIAIQQAQTREWWEQERHAFDLLTSEVVLAEASAGDAKAAEERLQVLRTLRRLDITDAARALAHALLNNLAIPVTEDRDAAHVAISAVNGVNYLLTWNCRHLANANLRSRIESVCRRHGYEPPIICTPEELRKVLP